MGTEGIRITVSKLLPIGYRHEPVFLHGELGGLKLLHGGIVYFYANLLQNQW